MTARKSERLLNLVILLLVARNYTTKEQIRELMEPYREGGHEAFDRMFERDKDDLRALGIPLETGYVDKFFEDEPGYRIKRDAFELPAIDFAPDEVAVLGLAARVWRHAGLAAATSDALVKLKAAGLSLRPRAARPGAADARRRGAGVRGGVPGDGAPHARGVRLREGRVRPRPRTRHVEPWGVVTAQGRWYVAGLDTDRGEPRMFRLSRITSEVTPTGAPGSFTVPEDTDLRALSQSLLPRQPDRSAVVTGPQRCRQRLAPAGGGRRGRR